MEKKKPCRKNYLSKYPSYLYHLSLKCCWRKKKIISRIEHVDSFSSNLGRTSLTFFIPRLSPTGMKIIVTRADTFLFWPANCYILLWHFDYAKQEDEQGTDNGIKVLSLPKTKGKGKTKSGTDLYTISKMLTHSNIATTQIYANVVNDLKRKSSDKLSVFDGQAYPMVLSLLLQELPMSHKSAARVRST